MEADKAIYDEPYTEGQRKHLQVLEKRVRELEQALFTQVANISRHIQSALDNGMEDYRTFVVNGCIHISPDDSITPKPIAQKFYDLHPFTVVSTNEGNVEENLHFYKDVAAHYDWRYFKYPEEYPADYKPICRSYDRFIEDGMLHGHFTIDDLMQIRPEDIVSQVKIYI